VKKERDPIMILGDETSVAECILPEHYKTQNIKGQFIVDFRHIDEVPYNFMYLILEGAINPEGQKLCNYVFTTRSHHGGIEPQPDNCLTWRPQPHVGALSVPFAAKDDAEAFSFLVKLAAGVAAGVLPLWAPPDIYKILQEKWYNTVFHLMEHAANPSHKCDLHKEEVEN
jgi:hypothetical protein